LDGPPSDLARVRRKPERARYDRAFIDSVLDEALVCHVGTVVDGQPIVVPMMFARSGDELFIHGSTGSRLMRVLAEGSPAAVEVTLLDGLVLARSAVHHSMNYRSVIAYGRFTVATAQDKLRASEVLIERVARGRWAEVRRPSSRELAMTMVLSLSLTEASAKVREGWPIEEPEDLDRPVWAGVVPLRTVHGEPIPDPWVMSRVLQDA